MKSIVKIFLASTLGFASLTTDAQSVLLIRNAEDASPVAEARVWIPELNLSLVSTAGGEIALPSFTPSLQVHITAPGYLSYQQVLAGGAEKYTADLTRAHIALDEVVVREPYFALPHFQPSQRVALRTNTIQTFTASNLAEKLTLIPGVSQLSTGPGIGKPVIRGLSGNRIAVFNQGLRMENQQWGDEHGIGVSDWGIEGAEIVKDPSSLLYGSDALGGVVVLVDERFAAPGESNFKVRSRWSSNTGGWQHQAAAKTSGDQWRMSAFVSSDSNRDYMQHNGLAVDNTRFSNFAVRTSAGYNTERWSGVLRYAYLKEIYGIAHSEEEHGEEHEEEHEEEHAGEDSPFEPEEPYQEITTHTLSSENTLFLKNAKLRVTAGFIANDRSEYEAHHDHGETDEHEHEGEEPALNMLLRTGSVNVRWYGPETRRVKFIAGVTGLVQDNANRGEEQLIPDATMADAGGYVVASMGDVSGVQWQAGARVDMRSLSATPAGGNFSATYANVSMQTGVTVRLNDYATAMAGVSKGFRPPTLIELMADGEHHGTFRYLRGDSTLTPERSYQIDLTLQTQGDHLGLSLTPFFNRVAGFIYLQPTGEVIDDQPVYAYTQDDANLMGGEFSVHYHPHAMHWLHTECSQSLLVAQRDNGTVLTDIPGQQTRVSLAADLLKDDETIKYLQCEVSASWNIAPALVAGEDVLVGDYALLNAGLSLELSRLLPGATMAVSVRNLLDRRFADALSRYRRVGFFDPGRNIQVALQIPVTVTRKS